MVGTRTHVLLAAALAVSAGCEDNDRHVRRDADVDEAPRPDADPVDAQAALAVDFTVTGCATFDTPGGVPRCAGTAPMTVQFAPVASASFDVFRWDFGDGSPVASVRSPTHTYALPGSYDVALIAGFSAGSMMTGHEGLIQVLNVSLGGPCQVDGQCGANLSCLCGAGSPCGPAFTSGLCSAACDGDAGTCPEGSVCADLTLSTGGNAAAEADPWRAAVCLAPCDEDGDCPSGQSCRVLPAPGTPLRWVKACFAAVPADVGAACRDARGLLTGSLCSTGYCADLGALGVCTLDCSSDPGACPESTSCVVFNDGRKLCLRKCTAATDCDRDPLLECEPPEASGALGFRADSGSYCAPRTCTSYAECAPTGVCASGHCVAKPRS